MLVLLANGTRSFLRSGIGASSACGVSNSLYIPQESSAFRCNPLGFTANHNLYEISLKKPFGTKFERFFAVKIY
jgi:hypothetical protein